MNSASRLQKAEDIVPAQPMPIWQQERIAQQSRTAILPRFTGSQNAKGFIDANLPQLVGFMANKDWKGMENFLATKQVKVFPPDRLDILNWAQNTSTQNIIRQARSLAETRQNVATHVVSRDMAGAKSEFLELERLERGWSQLTGQGQKTHRDMIMDVRQEIARQTGMAAHEVDRKHGETLINAAKRANFSVAGLPGLFGLGEMGGVPQAEAAAAAQAFALAMYFQGMWADIYDKAKSNLGRESILAAEEQKNKARARPQEESPQERIKKLEAKNAEVNKLFDDLNKQLGVSPAAVAAGSQFDAKPLEEVATLRVRTEKKPVDVETQEAPKSGGGTAIKVTKAGTKGAERETRNRERDAEPRVQPVRQSSAEPKFDADTVGRVAAIKIAMSKLPGIQDPSEHKKALEEVGKMILDAIAAIKAKAQLPSGKQAKA